MRPRANSKKLCTYKKQKTNYSGGWGRFFLRGAFSRDTPYVCNHLCIFCYICFSASFCVMGTTCTVLLRRYQVGRALRAVDSRLKRDWTHWAENGLYCKDIRQDQRRQKHDLSSTGEMICSTLVGLARKTNMEQEHGAASLSRPSAEARGLLQRQRRRLRAWCSKVCVEAPREGRSVAMSRNISSHLVVCLHGVTSKRESFLHNAR